MLTVPLLCEAQCLALEMEQRTKQVTLCFSSNGEETDLKQIHKYNVECVHVTDKC